MVAASPQLEYSHYLHRANTHLEPALHYSHRIIIWLKIFKTSNNVNIPNTSKNASKYLHYSHKNMQILGVITRITCNTCITCIEHANNASNYSHYLYYLHYSNIWELESIWLALFKIFEYSTWTCLTLLGWTRLDSHNTHLARPWNVFFVYSIMLTSRLGGKSWPGAV